MSEVGDAAPAAWPSYSDLARIVGMSISGFGRYVRSWRDPVVIREIGREKRVAPVAAVALLEGRGLPAGVAEREVIRLIADRGSAVPVLARQSADDPPAGPSDQELLEELRRRYEGMVGRMRTPAFDPRMRKVFSSTTPEKMSQAAAGLSKRQTAAGRHG